MIRSDKAKVTGAGSTNFGEITFSKAGVYRFLITEDKGSETGYTYDGSQWTLTVTVTDENGALKVSSAALMAGSAFLIGGVFCIRRKRRGSNR